MTAGGREFQVAGVAQLKDRLPMLVLLKGMLLYTIIQYLNLLFLTFDLSSVLYHTIQYNTVQT